MLKIYGDADVTVSVFKLKLAPVTAGKALTGAFCTSYLNCVVLNFSLTTNLPLYPAAVTPLKTNGVSTSRPETASVVVTVMVSLVADPSPALILEIPTVEPVEPTIRNSSIFG